ARVIPFAAFIAILAATPLLAEMADPRWIVAGRGLVVGLLLLYFWRHYEELRGPAPGAATQVLAVALGALVFGAWILFDQPWAVIGAPGPGFIPVRDDGALDPWLVGLRLAGFVLVVPVMEELFWRSFLMRWIGRRDFLAA